MALAGEAAVRIVPSLKGFHSEAKKKLEAKRIDYDVNVRADTTAFHKQMTAARAWQESRPVTIPVRTDWNGLKKDLSQVEHIFQRNNLVKGIRFNIKVIGLDALPAMAYAAGSAASGLDALGKSALALPALLSAAGASIGTIAIGLSGIKDAFSAYGKAAKDSTQNMREFRDAQRDLQSAQRDVSSAIRDQRRELEDLNAELRRSTLDEADALLNLQESANTLKQGGFKSINEYQRAQLRFLRDIEGLKEVRRNNIRLLEDTADANEKGILQSDRVVGALDKVVSAVDRLNEAQKKNDGLDEALSKVSPNARKFIQAAKGMEGAWTDLKFAVQDNLFAGLDQSLQKLASSALPGLKIGLSQVATGLNANIQAAVDAIGNGKNADLWSRIFGNTQGGLTNFKNSLDPILTGFSRISEVGSTFLPRIGQAFTDVGRKFDLWTQKISTDGTLKQWIDQGLDAVTQLGNLAKNVGSIISSVGAAFNQASGTQGGFIKTFADATKRWADYLNGEGKQVLVDYFTKAKELIHTVGTAFGDMKPLIKDIVEAARNFTKVLLPVVGTLAKITEWIQEHTGLVTTLFYAYASYRTIRPIIDGIKGAWENYTKVVNALGKNVTVGNHFQSANRGLAQLKSNLTAVGGVAAGASTPIKTTATNLGAAAQSAALLISPANNATAAFSKMTGGVTDLKGKIGSVGSTGKATLIGALGGLASFIGPGLAAGVLGVALAAGFDGLMRLESAHDAAKDAANRQKEALDGLKSSLDEITGASTAASMKTAADIGQRFPMGPAAGGDRNVFNDANKAGLATTDQLLAATLPQNQNLANDIDKKVIAQATAKIANSPAWLNYKDRWGRAGVTPEILARASKGEPDAIAKVEEAERKEFGKARKDMNWLDRRYATNADRRLPSIADVITQSGTFEEAAVGSFLGTTRNQNVTQGDLIKQRSRALGGNPVLNQAGKDRFGKFGATDSEVYAFDANRSRAVIVVTSDPGTLDPEVGQVEQTNPNQWTITLTEDGTKQLVNMPKMATGGLIGGIGSGTSDSNLMLASKGEFVAKKDAVDFYGADYFHRLNNMELPKFDGGGAVPPPKIPWQEQAASALGAAGYTPANPFVSTPGPSPIAPIQVSSATPDSMSVSGPGGAFTGSIPAPPPMLSQPTPATPAPTGLPAPSGPAAPHIGTGAAPGPLQHMGTGAAPGPVAMGGGLRQRIIALSQRTGIPPALLMRLMPGGALMRSGSAQYTGLPVGTNIPYGQGGFPDWVYAVAQRFGVQASTYAGHQEGSGANKGIDWSGPADNMRAFAQYLTTAGIPGLEQVIFMDSRDGAKFGLDPGDRGPNQTIDNYYRDDWASHTNHVHTRMSASIPTPEELAAMGVDAGMAPAALLPGILSATGLSGFPTSLDPAQMLQDGTLSAGSDKKKSGLANLIDYFTNTRWLEPANVENFLTDQARNVGSSLLNIGLGFISGMTGLDFSSLVGTGQQIGNFILGAGSGGGSGGDPVDSSMTDINNMTADELDRYINGQLPLGATGGLDGLLGPDLSSLLGSGGMSGLLDQTGVSMSWNPGGGAEQWRPVVRRVLETYGPQYGLTNLKAWEDAIVKQIDTESKGNPGAKNPNDSDGKGGKQSVNGLLQFLPETFAANNITGGDYLDPVAQIAAVIPYVVHKYGMTSDGAPRQIGMGIGYKSGGQIKGVGGKRGDKNLIRVSRGEFIHNANAVDYYGADFLHRLNGLQIPKDQLPGFATGGLFDPIMAPPAEPAPPPPPPPMPAPPPPPLAPPADAGGQSAGPLPIAPSVGDLAPSTGGAPGPGATAPAPDPGALPSVADALAGVGGAIGGGGGGGLAQPGASDGSPGGDPRGTLGAAPASQEHNLPAVASSIRGVASTIGGLAAQAAQVAAMGASMGATGGVPVPGAAEAGAIGGQFAQAGAQIAGEVAVGAVNILSSLLVGTATNGSTSSASGVPLLPQRQPMQTGVPAINQPGRVHNGDIYVTNLDEYRRTQERMDAQAAMPFIGKY